MSEEVSAIGGVAGILILVVISMGILAYAFFYTDIFSWENLQKIAPTLVPPINQKDLSDETSIDLLGSSRAATDHTSATEVGCDIARAIKDDFLANGNEKTRKSVFSEDFQDLKGAGANKYIIKSGVFSMPLNKENENDYPDHIYQSLSSSAQDKLNTTCNNRLGYIRPCASRLDEACITNILSQFNVGEKSFCGAFPILGKGDITFGNSKCGDSILTTGVGKWVKDCGDLCGGPDKIESFVQQGEDINSPIIENDVGSDSATSMEDNIGSGIFVPECNHQSPCSVKYRYILYWDRTKSAYDIDIMKLPEEVDIGKDWSKDNLLDMLDRAFTKNDLIDQSSIDTKTSERKSVAGAFYPGLRMAAIFSFSPQNEILLDDFVNGFVSKHKQSTGENDWQKIYETNSCVSDGCLTTTAKRIKWKDQIEKDGELKKAYYFPADVHKLYVRTNMDPTAIKLSPSKKYKIALFSWMGPDIKDKQECGGTCGANQGVVYRKYWCIREKEFTCECLFAKGANADIYGKSCGESKYDSYDVGFIDRFKYYKYFDYTLVVIDVGERAEAESLPDLSASISLSYDNILPTTINIVVDVSSPRAVSLPFNVKTKLKTISSGETIKEWDNTLNEIAAGGNRLVQITTNPIESAGGYKVEASVDTDNAVEESDETNNIAVKTFSLG